MRNGEGWRGRCLTVPFKSFMQSLLKEYREELNLFPVQLGGSHMQMRGGGKGTTEPQEVTVVLGQNSVPHSANALGAPVRCLAEEQARVRGLEPWRALLEP